jgi:hypothetical protein
MSRDTRSKRRADRSANSARALHATYGAPPSDRRALFTSRAVLTFYECRATHEPTYGPSNVRYRTSTVAERPTVLQRFLKPRASFFMLGVPGLYNGVFFGFILACNEHSKPTRAPHTHKPRDVPRCGALSQVKLILSPKQRAKTAANRTTTCTNAEVCIASGDCPSRF